MAEAVTSQHPLEPLVRFVGFGLFSTIGMAVLALSILAEPLTQYYADQTLVRNYDQGIGDLGKVLEQHKMLLANLEDPSVMERAAINYLNYIPGDFDPARVGNLPEPWPALRRALSLIGENKHSAPPTLTQVAVQTVAGNTTYQMILLALGGALIVISMSCFCRSDLARSADEAAHCS